MQNRDNNLKLRILFFFFWRTEREKISESVSRIPDKLGERIIDDVRSRKKKKKDNLNVKSGEEK